MSIFGINPNAMDPHILHIAKEYKARLQNLYGDDLAEVILFGSYARGDNHEESDLDFAVILRDQSIRPFTEIAKISGIGSNLSLKYGITVSSLPVSLHKKQHSMQGVYQEIRKDGIVI